MNELRRSLARMKPRVEAELRGIPAERGRAQRADRARLQQRRERAERAVEPRGQMECARAVVRDEIVERRAEVVRVAVLILRAVHAGDVARRRREVVDERAENPRVDRR